MLKEKYSNRASKFLKKVLPKHEKQIANKIVELKLGPRSHDSILLKGKNPLRFRRVRVGEYRIIYRVEEYILFIDAVGKRNDGEIYKKFAKFLSVLFFA